MENSGPKHLSKTGPKEVLWFIGLWLGGVVTISIIGFVIKAILK
jgi:hypothetical protein